jgi:small subunit ribosomal protein S17
VVVSDAMEKTVVVRISSQVKHPLYGKYVRRTARFKAHDEAGAAHVGDTVRIVETRRLSKTKRWRVVEVVEKAK